MDLRELERIKADARAILDMLEGTPKNEIIPRLQAAREAAERIVDAFGRLSKSAESKVHETARVMPILPGGVWSMIWTRVDTCKISDQTLMAISCVDKTANLAMKQGRLDRQLIKQWRRNWNDWKRW
jgi:hypothetical protein